MQALKEKKRLQLILSPLGTRHFLILLYIKEKEKMVFRSAGGLFSFMAKILSR
jgi:hypothetical protein